MRTQLLFLTVDVPWDGGSGGQIVSWRILSAFAAVADVDVVALVPPNAAQNPALLEMARSYHPVENPSYYHAASKLKSGAIFFRSQVGKMPFRLRKFHLPEATAVVERLLTERQYDLVHCDHLSTVPYGLGTELPSVFLDHNVEWEMFARLAEKQRSRVARVLLHREARRTKAYERSAVGQMRHTWVLSGRDRSLLLDGADASVTNVSVWPVPVDHRNGQRVRDPDTPPSAIVLGSLRSIGRVDGLRWLLREVWPGVRSRRPDAVLHIAGAEPPPDIRAVSNRNGVLVHGFVEDLDALIREIDVCLVPLFVGGGIRIKVLEMLSMAVPCIGTTVAMQGLSELSGVVATDVADRWIEEAVGALSPSAPLAEAATQGALYLRENHSWSHASDLVAEQVLPLAAGQSGRSG